MNAPELVRLTLGQAEDRHAAGTLSDRDYRAYRRAWADAGGLERGYHGANGWSTPDDDPAVEELAAVLVRLAAQLASHRR